MWIWAAFDGIGAVPEPATMALLGLGGVEDLGVFGADGNGATVGDALSPDYLSRSKTASLPNVFGGADGSRLFGCGCRR